MDHELCIPALRPSLLAYKFLDFGNEDFDLKWFLDKGVDIAMGKIFHGVFFGVSARYQDGNMWGSFSNFLG